jgi:hypothetical protein
MGVASVQVLIAELSVVHKRRKEIGIEKQERAMELGWHYAEDGKGMLVDLDNVVNHAAILVEAAVPISIAEHDIGCTVRAMLVRAMENAATN